MSVFAKVRGRVAAAGGITPRRAVAAGGLYGSAALGVIGSLIAFRILGPTDAGRFAIVIGTVDFVATMLWLTSDEALIKYGFRYAVGNEWGKLRRLVAAAFRYELFAALAASAVVLAVMPFIGSIFKGAGGLETSLAIATLLPPLQALDSIGAAVVVVRGRYDVRGVLLALAMALRLVAVALGAPHGVTATVIGVVAAQAVTSATVVMFAVIALRRFPAADHVRLGDDRRAILNFVFQSSMYTSLISLRTWAAPFVLGAVRSATSVGYFRAAQTPQQGMAVLLAPVRLILLTEQTRDWEQGKPEVVFAGVRRYLVGSTLLMLVTLPPILWLMPWLVRLVFGGDYSPAVGAFRLVVVASGIQVVLGWTKSFAVTIGRPGLRLIPHGVEMAVLIPLIVVFGKLWGVTGGGGAVLVSTTAFALTWVAVMVWFRRKGFERPSPAAAGSALT